MLRLILAWSNLAHHRGRFLASTAGVAFAVFLITYMKGTFGGGFAIVGIPFMALVMDPIAAGALLAPVLCLSDIVAWAIGGRRRGRSPISSC